MTAGACACCAAKAVVVHCNVGPCELAEVLNMEDRKPLLLCMSLDPAQQGKFLLPSHVEVAIAAAVWPALCM